MWLPVRRPAISFVLTLLEAESTHTSTKGALAVGSTVFSPIVAISIEPVAPLADPPWIVKPDSKLRSRVINIFTA